MFCENSVEAYLAKFGIAKAGLICVPLNPMLAPDVVGYLLDLTEPRLLDRRRASCGPSWPASFEARRDRRPT